MNSDTVAPKMPVRVAVVIHSLAGGGAERVAVDLAQHLHFRGYVVSVLTLSGEGEDAYRLGSDIRRERIDIRRPARTIIQTIIFAFNQARRIRRKLIELDVEVLIALGDQNNVRVLLATIGSKIPTIISERVHPKHHDIGWKWNLARRVTYPLCSFLVVQTRAVESWCHKWVAPRKIRVIPNACRGGSFSKDIEGSVRQEPSRVILAAGRLVRQKGFDVLIRAFALSGLGQQGWRLRILGDGPARNDLVLLAEGFAVNKFLDMPGFAHDMSNQLRGAGIFAFSSRFEGFPNVLLEAMQVGLPCISTDCPTGPSDLIAHGDDGVLVPVDDVEAMADALRLLASDEALRRRLSIAARLKAECFSPERIYPLWECVLLDAAGRRE